MQWGALGINRLNQHLLGRKGYLLVVIHVAIVVLEYDTNLFLRSGQNLKGGMCSVGLLDIHHKILRGLFYYSHLAIRHEVLHKLLFLVRHQPGKVGLVLGINACH